MKHYFKILLTSMAMLGVVSTASAQTTQTVIQGDGTNGFKPHWEVITDLGAGFPENCLTLDITFSGAYFFTSGAYGALGLGYSYTSLTPDKFDVTSNVITVPLEVGYRFGSSKLGLNPYAGANLGLYIAKSAKYNGKSYDPEGTFGAEAKVGIRINLWDYFIGGSYHIPLNDDKKAYVGKDGYFHVSIGAFF